MFPGTSPRLDSPFGKYSEYNPPGNVAGGYEYVFFLFSARGLLTGESGTTFRSKDCGGYLAQYSCLLSTQEIIRSYSRGSSSPREQWSLSYPLSSISHDAYSPLCVLCDCLLTHCAAYVSLSIYPPVPWPSFCCSITLDRRAGSLHNQPFRKENSDCCSND